MNGWMDGWLCNPSEMARLKFNELDWLVLLVDRPKVLGIEMEKILRPLYTTTFSQKYSVEGNELAVCNNFGQISLYKSVTTRTQLTICLLLQEIKHRSGSFLERLSSLLSAENVDKIKAPHLRFEGTPRHADPSSQFKW